jgi:hypothetical protein
MIQWRRMLGKNIPPVWFDHPTTSPNRIVPPYPPAGFAALIAN